MNMRFIMSSHARQRVKERIGYMINPEYVYEHGRNLNKYEMWHIFEKGIMQDKYWDSIYKFYNNHLYVFRRDKNKLIFITVI